MTRAPYHEAYRWGILRNVQQVIVPSVDAIAMISIVIIFGLGLMPTLLSLVVIRRMSAQARQRLTRSMELYANRGVNSRQQTQRPQQHGDGVGYILGDLTCQFNARSPYLRCAVNPSGPCEACRFYQPQRAWVRPSVRESGEHWRPRTGL